MAEDNNNAQIGRDNNREAAMRPTLHVIEGGLKETERPRADFSFREAHVRRVGPLEEVMLHLLRRVPERAAAAGIRDMFALIDVAIDELTEAQTRYVPPVITLNEMILYALGGRADGGASLRQIRTLIAEVFGMQVQANHIVSVLHRYRRDGRVISHNRRWFVVEPVGGGAA